VRKLVIANRKGGCAKSTTAVHLAYGLSRLGNRVLLIDTDGQGSCSVMLGVQPTIGLAELMIEEVLPDQVLCVARENLSLLSGSKRLARAGQLIQMEPYRKEYFLSRKLEPFDGRFDFVIVDTPPSFSEITYNVFFYATEIMVPVNMEILSAYGFQDLLSEIQILSQEAGIELKYIVPTMADFRKGLTTDILEGLRRNFSAHVCDPIHYMARMSEIPKKGITIYEEDAKARPAVDYAKLTRRVVEDGKAA